VFHAVIGEKFFLGKVEPAILALGWEAFVPDFEKNILEQIIANPGSGAVIDLEEDSVDILSLLKDLQTSEATKNLPLLCYCSHELEDLIESAEAIGIKVVPRSVFAANLVRMLMELVGYDPTGERSGTSG